jgi:hypothetical protein
MAAEQLSEQLTQCDPNATITMALGDVCGTTLYGTVDLLPSELGEIAMQALSEKRLDDLSEIDLFGSDDEDVLAIIAEEEEKLRIFTGELKEKYLKAPTYVAFDFHAECGCGSNLGHEEMSAKLIHCDWWEELNGSFDEDGDDSRTYLDEIKDEFVRIVHEHTGAEDDLLYDLADKEVLAIIQDFGIPGAPTYANVDLARRYEEDLRARLDACSTKELKRELVDWLDYLNRKGVAAYGMYFGSLFYSIPAEWVLERLKDCPDVIGVEWEWDDPDSSVTLTAESTYADAVRFAREMLEAGEWDN